MKEAIREAIKKAIMESDVVDRIVDTLFVDVAVESDPPADGFVPPELEYYINSDIHNG